MQRTISSSSNHFSEPDQTETMPNVDMIQKIRTKPDAFDDGEIKLYKQLRPLLTLMKIFGLYYRKGANKYGKLRTEWCFYYCLLISILMIVNVIRSFSVYRIGDAFNHALVQKVMFTIWSTECTVKGIIMIRVCYRQSRNGLPYFFTEWKRISHNASLDKWGILMMEKYIFLTFLFLVVNSVVFLLVLQYVPVLDEIYLEVVWRDALKFGNRAIFNAVFGVLAVLNSTSSMFPVSLFVVLSCAVGRQLTNYNKELTLLTNEDDFHGKFEEFRLRHQNLCVLVDILDRVFSPMIAAAYCANIPMFCLVLYTMITSTDTHISLLLLHFVWLCFILLQLSIVSFTAAWVNCQAHSPLEHIYTIRFSSTSNDIQLQMYMFLNRLTGTQIGFTAMRLFVVDRPTILTIAGMMMTYFVILIQFKLPVIQADCVCNVTGTVHLENSSLEITQLV